MNCIVIDYKKMSLDGLLSEVKSRFGIEVQSLRRFRNLEANRLYFKDEYALLLSSLGFEESGTRLRLERGEIPVSGNIPIKVKLGDKVVEVIIPSDTPLSNL